jgi:hypothetical protein
MRPGPCTLLAALLLVASLAVAAEDGGPGEVVELLPDEPAGWSPVSLFAPITGFFLGGPGYWYRERRIEVQTTPPGALLDLFYVRANFQKAYEQSQAPVTIVLPSRIEAGKRDSVMIRAMLDGYRQQETHVRVRARQSRVTIELSPLANALVAMTHTEIAGRGSLMFLTKEPVTFRISKDSSGEVHSLVLLETGSGPDAAKSFDGVESSLIGSVRGQQLGEDLVVRLALTDAAREAGVDLRRRTPRDPVLAVRGLHALAIDLVPADGGADSVRRAHAALAGVDAGAVQGCALEYDAALREQLEPAALTRALSPRGAFTDPYLRAVLERLGEVSPGGSLRMIDGTLYRVAAPIELSAASSQAGEVRGYLAALRAFVDRLEAPAHRGEILRGLVAPELPSERFATILAVAEQREARCRGRDGAG